MIALFAEAPALPLHSAGKFVAGAYIVFALILTVYVVIMAVRLQRNQRELQELRTMVEERERAEAGLTGPASADTETSDQEPEQVA